LKAKKEMSITGQPVEFGNDQLGANQPTELKCFFQLQAFGLFAALDFDKLRHDLPIAAIEEILNGFALCFQAEPGTALPSRGNPQIRDEFALSHRTLPDCYVAINDG